MNCLNQIIFEGEIVNVGELAYLPNGAEGIQVTVSSSRTVKGIDGFTEEITYTDMEAYGAMAVSLKKHGEAGRGLRIVGRLKSKQWECEGKTFSKVYILAEHIEFKLKKLENK